MAKIKLSAIVSEMRGKLNGSVFSKNRGGAYLRTKVTPVNPQTIYQGNVRARLTTFSQAWRALTQAQILAWNSAVSNFVGTDIFGDIKTPSGINLYNKLNLNLAAAGQASIDNPPLPVGTGYISSMDIVPSAATDEIIVNFTAEGASVGQTIIVQATKGVSAGKNFVKSEYRQIDTLAGNSATGVDVGPAYVAKFGTMTEGQKVFIRLVFVDNTTGVSGQFTSASNIVAA
jgi:hypothetical protein